MRQNAGGNDTVPISVWRGGGMRCNKCCFSSWSFLGFFVLKWSVPPRVRAFYKYDTDTDCAQYRSSVKISSGCISACSRDSHHDGTESGTPSTTARCSEKNRKFRNESFWPNTTEAAVRVWQSDKLRALCCHERNQFEYVVRRHVCRCLLSGTAKRQHQYDVGTVTTGVTSQAQW